MTDYEYLLSTKISDNTIQEIVESAGIVEKISEISVSNIWIMELRKILLSNGKTLLLKVGINDEWTDEASIINQVYATKMLQDVGIPQPNILAYSKNKAKYGFRFLLSESHNNTKLINLYRTSNSVERIKIFQSLANAYSKIHSKKNSWSGVWNGSPDKNKYPIHPAQFYSNYELHNGSGYSLYEKGFITRELYENICNVWDSNLSFLIHRDSRLVHISPFPWSIYLAKNKDEYTVAGLAALGDFMWWDSMSDVAHLLYPPFMDITDEERKSFLTCYSEPVNNKAIALYRLLNRICAISDIYKAPFNKNIQDEWIQKEIHQLPDIIEEINSYSSI